MNKWYLVILLVCLGKSVESGVLTKLVTMPAIPEKVKPELADRVFHGFGDDHLGACPSEERSGQTNKLVEIFEKAEQSDERYHVMVEVPQLLFGQDYSGVTLDLCRVVQEKALKNTTIQDIEFRFHSGAAIRLLERVGPNLDHLNEKKWVEKLQQCPIVQHLPPELRNITLKDSWQIYMDRLASIHKYKATLPTKEWDKFDKLYDEYYEIHYALRYAVGARETFPFDMLSLTLRHVFAAYEERLKIAWQQYEELKAYDNVAAEVFKSYLEPSIEGKKEKVARCLSLFDQDTPLATLNYETKKYSMLAREKENALKSFKDQDINPQKEMLKEEYQELLKKLQELINKRKLLHDDIRWIFCYLLDHDVFHKVIMLEKKPEIKKIIFIGGTGHTSALHCMLRDTKRYSCILLVENKPIYPKERAPLWLGQPSIFNEEISVPLRLYIIELIQPPRKNLEWQILMKKYLYPTFWQVGITK